MARSVRKEDGPFLCPRCSAELNIRKGMIKIHHFAHKPPVSCDYGKGESEAHRKAKQSIFDSLRYMDSISELKIEKDWGSVVSDIYAVIQEQRIAIEVQISDLTMHQIMHRTKAYAALGIAVLWLPLFEPKLNKPRYAPRAWEKWLHATYFGRVYYWLEGLTVIPVRFASYEIEVEQTSWYNSLGEEQYAGGYSRRSKRWKTPKNFPPIQIPRDFVIRSRKAWIGGNIQIPSCRILLDKENAQSRKKS